MAPLLQQVGQSIWTYQGSTVSFFGFPFSTRMTIVRLSNGELWVHSPVKMHDDLKNELSALGSVKYLIAPNKLHHLFLLEWIDAFPDATTYAAPGLIRKRKDIRFDVELSNLAEPQWAEEIAQTIFRGSPAMEEVVFFHKQSSTLILTDLIENFHPDSFNFWQKSLAQFAGILYPNGKMPIDWRLSFCFGSKKKARKSLSTILSWQPDNIILSHGECVWSHGTHFLQSSFAWLQKPTNKPRPQ